MSLANWIWDYKKNRTSSKEDRKKEFKKDPFATMSNITGEKYKIVKEVMKVSKKTVTTIQKDAELQKIMNAGMTEIKGKLTVPKTISELLVEINK